jgi:ParB family chromosome partitioning protein
MSDDGKRRLGRGLSALFGDEDSATDAVEARRPTRSVPVEFIHPGRYQPRRNFDPESLAGLVESIRSKGVLQPLLVRRHPDLPNAFELIAGERRWRAAQQVPLHEVPVIVKDLTDRDVLEIGLVENLQREDLNPLEEADAYRRLMDEFGHTQEDLAQAVGKSRSHVANTLRLLGLNGSARAMLGDGRLSAGHARALIGATEADILAEEIVSRGLNVRQTEALVAQRKQAGKRRPMREPGLTDANTRDLERELTSLVGLNVKLNWRGKAGTLTIEYRTLDQLDHFIKRIR